MPKTKSAQLAPVVAPQADASAADRLATIPADVSLMTLDAGLYCVLVSPSPKADAVSGLPGVRISPAPGTMNRPDSVQVRTVSADGWLSGFGDAALVRVSGGPGQVMVTIYHRPGAGPEGAPQLQVLPLLGAAPEPAASLPPPAQRIAQTRAAPAPVELIAHIQTRGDVGGNFGEWLGVIGSGHWIEGFGIAPSGGIPLADIEYQAVLGRGWVSPWVEGGQFCGSRGMALPVLGLRVRLRGETAKTHAVSVMASFVDGSKIGPVNGGEPCETDGLAPVEAIWVTIQPIGGEADVAEAPKPASKPRAGGKPSSKRG